MNKAKNTGENKMTDKELVKEALNQRIDALIAGALFDFMGWLTSREERIVLSSTDEASPAVEAIKQFAKMRGLSLDNANVQGWVRKCTENLQQPKTNQCAETCERAKLCAVCGVSLNQEQEQEPVAEVKAKMTGGNVGIATVIHEIYSPFRDRLQPGDKLYLIRT